ncbi:MAG TPA: PQQ-binding-like beta-propeller repeat protein [Pirellulales bacterium]|nr:PQQ-binding-like beta-propeller repeat protein [Pirellulales bacterium]
MNKRFLLLTGFLSLVGLTLAGANWPQWRGPHRDGLSAETGLLAKWPEGGPKLLWQVNDVGGGYSTPAVVGERLYLLGNEGMDNEFVQALDVANGKQMWSVKLGKVGPNKGPQYPGSRSTPTVDGSLLYALGSDGDLACLEASSGKEHWRLNLRDDFAGKPGNWAYSESPLIDGDVLVCTPGGSEATLVGLNKTTGETIWKCAVPGGDEAAYASAIVVEAGGVKQYVQFLQKGLVGVEAETGKFLWRYDATAKGSPANIPTPVAHEGFVFSGTGRGGGGVVKVSAEGDKVMAEEVYAHGKLPTSIGGAVLLDGFLYGTNSQGLLCVGFATGELKWQDRSVGAGAVCYADGSLYVHGEEGDVALVEATPDAYHERGRFTPPDQPDRGRSKAWAYPVVANGRLYLRDMGTLWCYSVAEE